MQEQPTQDQSHSGDTAINVRRVVTGFTADGRSTIVSDGPSPTVLSIPVVTSVEVWKTEQAPADIGPLETVDGPIALNPVGGGVICRVCHFPPDDTWKNAEDPDLGRDAFSDAEASDDPFHTTDSVDYIQVLSGEIYAVLDEAETRLGPGDVLIQRGTSHAWSNRSDEPCVLVAILIGADPATRPTADAL